METRNSSYQYFLPYVVDDIAIKIVNQLSDDDLASMALVCKKWRDIATKVTAQRYLLHFKQQPNMQNVRSQYFALIKEEVKALYATFTSHVERDNSLVWYQWDKQRRRELFQVVRKNSKESVERIIKEFDIHPRLVERNQFLIEQVISTIINLPENVITQAFINKLFILEKGLDNSEQQERSVQLFDTIFKGNITTSNKDRIKFLKLFHAAFCIISAAGLIELCKFLISKHPDLPKIMFKRGDGASILHTAIDGKHYDLARYLITKGADVNQVTALMNKGDNCTSSSPLLYAMQNLREDFTDKENELAAHFILELLNAGADPMLECDNEETDMTTTPYLALLELHQNNKIKPMLNLFSGTMTKNALPKFLLLLLKAFSQRIANTLEENIVTPIKNRCSIV